MYAFLLKPALLHCWARPNIFTMLSYTQSCNIVEVYPTLKHCWAIHCLSKLSKYGRSKYTAISFRATLSAANQNSVIRHPISQWKIDLTKWQPNIYLYFCGRKVKNNAIKGSPVDQSWWNSFKGLIDVHEVCKTVP